jgi:two-component system, cell cycle response regulator
LTLPGGGLEHRPLSLVLGTTMPDSLFTDLDRVPFATPAERSAHRAAVASRRGGGGRAVLVVDTSRVARKFLMQRLEALGYRAFGADSGEAALPMIEQQPFAIVFLEFVLGPPERIDGLGLCQAIKQKPDRPDGVGPAVVMATGRIGASDRVRATLAGCDAYLTKPLGEAAFAAALGSVDPLFN